MGVVAEIKDYKILIDVFCLNNLCKQLSSTCFFFENFVCFLFPLLPRMALTEELIDLKVKFIQKHVKCQKLLEKQIDKCQHFYSLI